MSKRSATRPISVIEAGEYGGGSDIVVCGVAIPSSDGVPEDDCEFDVLCEAELSWLGRRSGQNVICNESVDISCTGPLSEVDEESSLADEVSLWCRVLAVLVATATLGVIYIVPRYTALMPAVIVGASVVWSMFRTWV